MNTADYNKKMEDTLNLLGVTVDHDFNFNPYNQLIRDNINGGNYLFNKEPLKKACSCLTLLS